MDLSPDPYIRTQEDERYITVSVTVEWSSSGDLSDEVVVDASALGFRDMVVESVAGWATPGMSWTLEFDGTTNELLYHYVADASADQPPQQADVDFYMSELHGLRCQTSGGTGDIILTTSGAAANSTLSFILRLARPGPVNRRHLDRSHLLHR